MVEEGNGDMRRRGGALQPGKVRPSRARRGAIALEYVLLAAFMAIALMAAFGYFRRTLDRGMRELSAAAAFATSNSVKEAMDKLGK